MRMYNITALSPDNTKEVYSGVFYGEDDDEAIEVLDRYLDEIHVDHGLYIVDEME